MELLVRAQEGVLRENSSLVLACLLVAEQKETQFLRQPFPHPHFLKTVFMLTLDLAVLVNDFSLLNDPKEFFKANC